MLRTGRVTATNLNLRPTPSTAKPPLAVLPRDTRLWVDREKTGWLHVRADGVHPEGWVYGNYVALDPTLIVDLYWDDLPSAPKWGRLAKEPGFVGAILKATEGVGYSKKKWFQDQWPALLAAAPDRYGTSWFRGAYHFLRFATPGADQADDYLRTVDIAGGWSHGDLCPIVDVERCDEGHPNFTASKQQVIDCVSAWSARVKAKTGRKVVLYGRGAMRDLGITSRMGCDFLWNPSYTSSMRSAEACGWPSERVAFWQYTDGQVNKTQYPTSIEGFGAVDASVFRLGHIDDLDAMLT
jgi:hypothetical protein